MIEPMTRIPVVVQRQQDTEPFQATIIHELFMPILNQNDEVVKGPSLGFCIQDERGFEMYAQSTQMEVA